jgi:hypothetical protein
MFCYRVYNISFLISTSGLKDFDKCHLSYGHIGYLISRYASLSHTLTRRLSHTLTCRLIIS